MYEVNHGCFTNLLIAILAKNLAGLIYLEKRIFWFHFFRFCIRILCHTLKNPIFSFY
jgi:hypothetical protein